MKIRTMEVIPAGFQFPATPTTPKYSGEPLECNVVAEVKDDEAAMLCAAGVAEPAEKKGKG